MFVPKSISAKFVPLKHDLYRVSEKHLFLLKNTVISTNIFESIRNISCWVETETAYLFKKYEKKVRVLHNLCKLGYKYMAV